MDEIKKIFEDLKQFDTIRNKYSYLLVYFLKFLKSYEDDEEELISFIETLKISEEDYPLYLASKIYLYFNLEKDNKVDKILIELKKSCLEIYYFILRYLVGECINYSLCDSALKYLLELKEYFSSINDEKNLADMLNDLSIVYRKMCKFTQALKSVKKSIKIYEKDENPNLTLAYNNLASIYYMLDNHDKALDNFIICLELAQKNNQPAFEQIAYNNIGNIYNDTSDYENAKIFYLKALEIKSCANTLMNLGIIYTRQKYFVKAMEYFNQAYETSKIESANSSESLIMYHMADCYMNMGLINESINHLTEAKKLASSHENDYLTANINSLFGENFIETKDYAKAIEYFTEALTYYEKEKLNTQSIHCLKCLINALKKQNNTNDILIYQDKLIQLIQEKHETETEKRLNDLKIVFEIEQKEKEKELFRQKNIELSEALNKNLELTEKLSIKNEENERMLRILSHDLSSSLQLVTGLTELNLLYINDPEILAKNLSKTKMVSINTLDLLNHVKNMLAFESGKAKLTLSKCDIREVLLKARSILSYKLHEKKIDFEIKIHENIDKVFAEPISLLNSVVLNILSNALKFSFENSTIKVSVYPENEFIVMSFQDYGTGIKKDQLENIFSNTGQTSTTGTKGEQGTGFGMPLIKKYIQLYNGKLELHSNHIDENKQEHGTKIIIKLQH